MLQFAASGRRDRWSATSNRARERHSPQSASGRLSVEVMKHRQMVRRIRPECKIDAARCAQPTGALSPCHPISEHVKPLDTCRLHPMGRPRIWHQETKVEDNVVLVSPGHRRRGQGKRQSNRGSSGNRVGDFGGHRAPRPERFGYARALRYCSAGGGSEALAKPCKQRSGSRCYRTKLFPGAHKTVSHAVAVVVEPGNGEVVGAAAVDGLAICPCRIGNVEFRDLPGA